ncbi:MAG: dephospho-CoA kinase [Muribaculaceae bacterium]|nr:dephospho-CoA kinase [Muribaculaceae bacterium]
MNRQTRVCITGGIGSGKSVISRILRLKGYRVYDCDSEAKKIMESSPEIIMQIEKILNCSCIDSIGQLNKKAIADIIFADKEKRQKVNSVVHKAVRDDFNSVCSNHKEKIVFIETAIPSTAAIADMVDRIWLVSAPETLRMSRIKIRNGLSECEIKKRISSQKAEFDSLPAEKTSVIINDGISPVLPEIDSLLSSSRIFT